MSNLRKRSLEDSIVFQEQLEFCRYISDNNRGLYPKYYIETLGCQMNHADSEQIAGMLIQMGYTQTEDISLSDIIVFNTCCVRENAELKLYGRIGELKALKQQNKQLITVVCGCMMQQEHVVQKIKNSYKYIDIVFGTHNRHEFPRLVYERVSSQKRIFEVWEDNKGIAEQIPIQRTSSVSAFVPITHGCNNFCTYCIVPYVRGREISRSLEHIRNDILKLADNGIKEVTLLGQNVNSYSSELSFPQLLYNIADINGIERIRFMTSHPKDLSDELITAMADIDKVCSSIHLPLQSGSNAVLKEMNRKYTKESYLDLVYKLRENVKNISISTDIIVGFPGESENDFMDTLDVYNKAQYDFAYTFIYSKRTGTPAAKREDQVDDAIKNERFSRLVQLVNDLTLKSNQRDLGSIQKVLVEGTSRTHENILTGRSEHNKIVNFDPLVNKESNLDFNSFTGNIIDVKINKSQTWHLEGEEI